MQDPTHIRQFIGVGPGAVVDVLDQDGSLRRAVGLLQLVAVDTVICLEEDQPTGGLQVLGIRGGTTAADVLDLHRPVVCPVRLPQLLTGGTPRIEEQDPAEFRVLGRGPSFALFWAALKSWLASLFGKGR